jgi:DNA-binding MarR family transcriptional regulator
MNRQAVLQKTEKGVEEVKTRANKLEQKLRMLLIVVNGKATGADLAKQFEAVGDITPMLEQLIAQGYVREAAGGADFRDIRVRLSQALTDAMGPAGDTIVMQLQDCRDLESLRAFVERHLEGLQGAYGRRMEKFAALARELLG